MQEYMIHVIKSLLKVVVEFYDFLLLFLLGHVRGHVLDHRLLATLG